MTLIQSILNKNTNYDNSVDRTKVTYSCSLDLHMVLQALK